MRALFADPDDDKSDAGITQATVQEHAPGWLEKTVADGQRFLIPRELPMSLIRTSANRYLVTEAEQRQWLQTLLDRVLAEFVARKVEPDVGEHRAHRNPTGRSPVASTSHVKRHHSLRPC